jgi:hypothetical protein
LRRRLDLRDRGLSLLRFLALLLWQHVEIPSEQDDGRQHYGNYGVLLVVHCLL